MIIKNKFVWVAFVSWSSRNLGNRSHIPSKLEAHYAPASDYHKQKHTVKFARCDVAGVGNGNQENKKNELKWSQTWLRLRLGLRLRLWLRSQLIKLVAFAFTAFVLSLFLSICISLSHAAELWIISAQIMAYNNSYTNNNNNNSNSNKRSTKWTRQSKQLTWRRHIKIPLCQTPVNLRVWLGVELGLGLPLEGMGELVELGAHRIKSGGGRNSFLKCALITWWLAAFVSFVCFSHNLTFYDTLY